MRQLIITIILISLNFIGNAQIINDSIILLDNSRLQSCIVYENIYNCGIGPFDDGENPVFSDERDSNLKTTLFDKHGKEIELPEEPERFSLEICAESIRINLPSKTITITGYVSSGWYGAGSHVHVYIGQKVDTINNITLAPNLHGPTYYNGKKVKKPIVIDTIPVFKLVNYTHTKSEVGFVDHEKRSFKISSKFEKNSILVFGLSSSYAAVFEIGRFLKENDCQFNL